MVRGYGRAHQRMRRDWAPLVEAGQVDCWRCGERIPSGDPWDLGHDDIDRAKYRGPEHQRCNRATRKREPNAPAAVPYLPPGGRMRPRECAVCATAYVPSYSGQRTCGRACGAELQRRNRRAKPVKAKQVKWAQPEPIQICSDCGSLHTRRSGRCEECAVEWNRVRNRNISRARAGRPLDESVRAHAAKYWADSYTEAS